MMRKLPVKNELRCEMEDRQTRQQQKRPTEMNKNETKSNSDDLTEQKVMKVFNRNNVKS